jgi:pimeloyl-ACP methyl ester carboxylesterase
MATRLIMAMQLLLPFLCGVPCAAQSSERRVVQVTGHAVSVRTGGWHLSSHAPTVVLEAAFGEGVQSWDSIFEQLAARAPVVAYDRAGIGGSEYDGQLPTPRHVGDRLHGLLVTLGAKPPYVLVGHSWGGPLVRMYAALYASEIAGIVYIDPTDLRTLAEEKEYYAEQGYVGKAMEERKRSLLTFRNPDQPGVRVLLDTVQGDFKEFRALPPLRDVPMAMLMSASFGPESWRGAPCQPKQCEEALVKWRIHWLRQMMEGMTNATLTVATGVSHFMQSDDPQLVLSAVDRVIAAAVKGGR